MFNIITSLIVSLAVSAQTYDCKSKAPEMAGHHNMVLFGKPGDLYAYHLPLFAGKTNGQNGHVLMHIYQGIWSVKLDNKSATAYNEQFGKISSAKNPIPFFSFAPQGKRFKVPNMICNTDFQTDALAVYGHVENNPVFPKPKRLISGLSKVIKQQTLFARKFNGESKDQLSYLLFGNENQYYLAHFLTDDENSFDQILAIKGLSDSIKNKLAANSHLMVSISATNKSLLKKTKYHDESKTKNNKWMVHPKIGLSIPLTYESKPIGIVELQDQVYFNDNGDLTVKP